jgi:2-keto-3-deoxy-L-rhamnonate aldolase RhmA
MTDRQAPSFELFLFTSDIELATRAVGAGIDGIVIDWERNGKHARQHEADTEVSEDTVDDLRLVRAATPARILCRVNPLGDETADEIAAAAEAGANELLLPMVRDVSDVEQVLELSGGRIDVGILVETVEAVANVRELARLPLSRVFLGLNDLALQRGTASIFTAVADGTADDVRAAFDTPFGVAGVTLPDAGDPISCRLLIGELARLECDFTFLRRSFRRDVVGRSLDIEVPRIREALLAASMRSLDEVHRDRAELVHVIRELETLSMRESAVSIRA